MKSFNIETPIIKHNHHHHVLPDSAQPQPHHHHQIPVIHRNRQRQNKRLKRLKRLKQVQLKVNPTVLSHLISVSNDLSLNKNLIGGKQPLQPSNIQQSVPELKKSGMDKESQNNILREVLNKEENKEFNENVKNKEENMKDDLIDKNLTLFSLEKSQMAAN